MRRREFIAGFAAMAASPTIAPAQRKLPTVGLLGTASSAAMGPWMGACVHRPRELGWIDGQNVTIDLRWADGRPERMVEIATVFSRLNVDVIPAAVPEMRQVQDAARMLGLQSELLDVRRVEDIGPAVESVKGKVDALYVQSGPLMNT